MKKLFSVLLSLLVVMSLATPAAAKSVDDPGTVNLGPGKTKTVVITPDLGAKTTSDLFGNFKGIMPGDKRNETISIRNWALQYDYVKVYLEAVAHDGGNAPKIGDKHNGDFLEQLELIVMNGSKVIYHAGPEESYQLDAAGDLKNAVYLGELKRSNSIKAMELDVKLIVPLDLGNEFADQMGEVDWVFRFEGFNKPSETPKTGDYVLMVAIPAMGISALALVLLVLAKKKRKV